MMQRSRCAPLPLVGRGIAFEILPLIVAPKTAVGFETYIVFSSWKENVSASRKMNFLLLGPANQILRTTPNQEGESDAEIQANVLQGAGPSGGQLLARSAASFVYRLSRSPLWCRGAHGYGGIRPGEGRTVAPDTAAPTRRSPPRPLHPRASTARTPSL